MPNDWRDANVSPVSKCDSRAVLGNRPVSLTCVLSKFLESINRDDLVDYLEGAKVQTLLDQKKWTLEENRTWVKEEVAYYTLCLKKTAPLRQVGMNSSK